MYRQAFTWPSSARRIIHLGGGTAHILGQMRQLYGKALGLVGLDAMFLRL